MNYFRPHTQTSSLILTEVDRNDRHARRGMEHSMSACNCPSYFCPLERDMIPSGVKVILVFSIII